jgi:hypothetical protein
MGKLFDGHFPEWRRDSLYLRYAIVIPLEQIRDAHARAKAALLEEVQRRTGTALDPAVLTVGFARRATPYKRADLIFTDLERLKAIARTGGRLQILYGGKAHPRDEGGKELIHHIVDAAHELDGCVRVLYLENYEMDLARLLTSGVDVWLNNPMKPLEASGTSGMKAALNGVPSFSVLDGWWIEGHIEGVTGWSIGGPGPDTPESSVEANDLYTKLEQVVLPLFYNAPLDFAKVMRYAIALNGSFFNTQRMVMQYVRNAYFPRERGAVRGDRPGGRGLRGVPGPGGGAGPSGAEPSGSVDASPSRARRGASRRNVHHPAEDHGKEPPAFGCAFLCGRNGAAWSEDRCPVALLEGAIALRASGNADVGVLVPLRDPQRKAPVQLLERRRSRRRVHGTHQLVSRTGLPIEQ